MEQIVDLAESSGANDTPAAATTAVAQSVSEAPPPERVGESRTERAKKREGVSE